MIVAGNRIVADEGKAIRTKYGNMGEKTMITEVFLSGFDRVENWEDCEYGDDVDATEADKDAALETLGVDMTEG